MKALIALPRGEIFDTFFPPENIALAESLGEIVWNDLPRQLTPEEAAERLSGCDTYITAWSSPRLDETLLAAAPGLRLLTHLCGTVVPVVSDAMWARGIRVLSGNRFFAESVAEGTLAYILAALRDIPYYSSRLKNEGKWKKSTSYNAGLAGKTVGIVSYGTIARHLVRLLSAFRVRIRVYDIAPLPAEDILRYGLEQVSLETIFEESDIISLHTPLLPETHLIGADLLSRIRPGALFVNTARGAVVDQAALEAELADGRFRAFLDVYEKEPPPPECSLYRLANVMMMPHMGGPTIDLRQYIARDLLLESAAFIDRGEPLQHEVSREMAAQMSNS